VSLAFRAAVEARDIDAMVEALAPDVKFHSPMAHRPFEGRDAVRVLFTALFETFEDFHYTDELEAGDGTHALVFRARVGDKQLQGLDLMRMNDEGLIHEFTVMIRPASGLMALGQAMAPKVETLK
jgi:SnoaL-like protein